jgi:hypothetical protein
MSYDWHGFAGDTLTSHSGHGDLLVLVDWLAEGETFCEILFQLHASLSHSASDGKFEHTEILNTYGFLEVALWVDWNKFIFFIKIVELDGPDFFETLPENFSSLKS